MATYRFLSKAQLAAIWDNKVLELEAEHARLALDLRLARATNVENESVDTAQKHLNVLVAQMAALTSWMSPEPEQIELANSNGARADP